MNVIRIFLIFVLVISASACGYKAGLTLPEAPTATSQADPDEQQKKKSNGTGN